MIDLFVVIEQLFQGTLYFVLKFVFTFASIIVHPVRHSLETFERFKSASTKEVGPATFLVIGVSAFWATSLAVLMAGSTDDFLPLLDSLAKTFDASPLRAPLIMTSVGAASSIFLLEMAYRAVGCVSFPGERAADDRETLRAVAFYTTGAAALMLPLLIALGWIASAFFSAPVTHGGYDSESTMRTMRTLSSYFVDYGTPIAVLSPPALCSWAITSHLRRASAIPNRLSGLIASAAIYIATVLIFAVSAKAVGAVGGFFLGGPHSVIADIDCMRQNLAAVHTGDAKIEDAVVAVVELKNTADHAMLVDTGRWSIEISDSEHHVYSESSHHEIDGKANVFQILIKPKEMQFVTVWFAATSQELGRLPFGTSTCRIWRSMKDHHEKKQVLGGLH